MQRIAEALSKRPDPLSGVLWFVPGLVQMMINQSITRVKHRDCLRTVVDDS